MNLRKEAKGRECTVRIRDVCNFNTETTVLAHLNSGGMALKTHDFFAAISCSSCHEWLDGGYTTSTSRDKRDLEHFQSVIRTQKIWIDEGKVK